MFPQFFHYLSDIKKYYKLDFRREINGWLRIIRYYKYYALIAILVIAYAATFVHLTAPKEFYIGSGSAGSIYSEISRKLEKKFKDYGTSLKLVNTDGRIEEFEKLKSDKSPIAASFYVSGTADSKNEPDLVSLGSIGYAPLWLFTRTKFNDKEDPFDSLKNKRIAVGLSGSISNKLFHQFKLLNNKDLEKKYEILTLPHEEAADLLKKGQIDAMFIVDAFDSEIIQSLINNPSLNLFSFDLADAYIAKFPFLTKVTIPRGAFDIDAVRPAKDLTLLSSTISLLIEKNTHRAIQWGFLSAVEDISLDDNGFFRESTQFPKYLDKSFKLSEVASRYYKSGIPVVFNYFPLWIASIVDYIWVYVLTLILVVSPLLAKLSKIRGFSSKLHMDYFFLKLRYAQDTIKSSNDIIAIEQEIENLNTLSRLLENTWFAEAHMVRFFTIQSNLENVKKQASEKMYALNNRPIKGNYLGVSTLENNQEHSIDDDDE